MEYEVAKEEAEDRAERAEQRVLDCTHHSLSSGGEADAAKTDTAR